MNTMAADVIRSVDPVALAADAGLDPDPWQRDVLRSGSDRILVNGSRQVDKSAVSGLLALHQALYAPKSLALLVAPASRQSVETFRTCLGLYKALGRPVAPEAENTMALVLENGSRILALPGSETTLRGYGAVSLMVIDEAARVSDLLYHSVMPMLSVSRGRVIAISTPNGRRGWWYAAWSDEGSRWERHVVLAADCPRIASEFLAEQRREMPGWMFAQEYEGVFGDSDRAAFSSEDIEAAFAEEVRTWQVFGG
jgi:hypothetical protein